VEREGERWVEKNGGCVRVYGIVNEEAASEPDPSMIVAARTAETLTAADLLEQLGGVPAERVLVRPAPGTATEKDVIRLRDRTGRLCELVDGVLVEKTVGLYESRVAIVLGYFWRPFWKRTISGSL
jgi:hypothetical protein